MTLTKKQAAAIDRIIAKTPPHHRDQAGENSVVYRGEDDGIVITNGHVLLHAPEPLGYRAPKKYDPRTADKLNAYIHAPFEDYIGDFFKVVAPIQLEKCASTLRKGLKKHAFLSSVDKIEVVRFTAMDLEDKSLKSAFAVDSVVDAFEAVGKDAVGYIGSSSAVPCPAPYMIVEPANGYGNLKIGIHALVMPCRY